MPHFNEPQKVVIKRNRFDEPPRMRNIDRQSLTALSGIVAAIYVVTFAIPWQQLWYVLPIALITGAFIVVLLLGGFKKKRHFVS